MSLEDAKFLPHDPAPTGDAHGNETLIVWLRQDIQQLSANVERLAGIVVSLETKVAPILLYQQPCPMLTQHLAKAEETQNRWLAAAVDLGKTAVVAAVVTLLILWKKH